MNRRRIGIAAVIALLLVASIVLLLWPSSDLGTTRGPSTTASAPRAQVPSPRPTPRPPTTEAVVKPGGPEAWFPDKQLHRCPAPAGLPEGRFVAGGARVLVRGGEVVVAGDDAGQAPVREMGTVVGHVSWEAGTCVVSEAFRFEVRGRVAGGGEHLIAGCPIGETVRTDGEGRFTTTAVEGQPCMLRVVDVSGALAMGPKVPVAADADADVILEPAEPLDPRHVAMGEDMLVRMVAERVARAEIEVSRWAELDASDPWVAWMQEQAEAELAFFTAEQQHLDDPEGARQAVAELLLGTNN